MSRKFNFESLADAEKNQSVQDELAYKELLREIAADKCTRSDAEVLEILRRAGRDGKTLEEDAAERAKRDSMIADLKRLDVIQAERDELLRQAKTMREEFEKIETEYEEKRNPILWKIDGLDKTIREIERYRDRLYENCPDTQLKIDLDILEKQFDHRAEAYLYERQRKIESEIRDAQQELGKKVISPTRKDEERFHKAKIKELQAEFQQIETKKEELAQMKAEHKAAVEKIKEQMIFA